VSAAKPPRELDRAVDAVFRYAPKPKSKAAKKRKRRAKKVQRESSI